MTQKAHGPQVLESPRDRNDHGSGSETSLPHAPAPRVPGRVDTYKSRSTRWHRQVRIEKCPRCGHPHLHRAPLPLVRAVVKTAPCGLEYVVVLRPVEVIA